MELIEKTNCFLFGEILGKNTIAGFSKSNLKGNLPDDFKESISFLNQNFNLSYMNQEHSSKVCCLDHPGVYDGDGIFSKAKNNFLIVRTADCLPLIFSNQNSEIIGVVHMGWRSAQKGILSNIGFDLSDFKVIASLGLRKCCYEVGSEFSDYGEFKPYLGQRDSKLYFDPIAFARETLAKEGLKEENFFDLNLCTYCGEPGGFSFRKNKTTSRILSFIAQI